MENELKEYFKSKNISTAKDMYVKSGELEVLMIVLATDPSVTDLRSALKESWIRIIGTKPEPSDLEFVDNFKFSEYPLNSLDKLNKFSLGKTNYIGKIIYLRNVWFFAFLAKNYQEITINRMEEIVNEIKQREIDYKMLTNSNNLYKLTSLNHRYFKQTVSMEDRQSLGSKIAKKYLDDLETAYEETIEAIAKGDANLKNRLLAIFNFSTDTSRFSKEYIDTICKPVLVENAPSSNDKEVKKTAKAKLTNNDDSVIKLIKHTEIPPKENYEQIFEENLNTIFDLSQKISEVYKQDGIEEFL